jgi:hypothetical protein
MNTTNKFLIAASSVLVFAISAVQAAEKTGEKSDESKTSSARAKVRGELDFYAAPRDPSPPPPSIYTGNSKPLSPAPAPAPRSSSSSGRSTANKAD